MSGTISASLLPFGEAGRLGAAALSLNTRYGTLQAQEASGLVAPNVADLGASTEPVLDLQPQIAALDGWNANITTASNRLSVAQSALGGITAIADTLTTTLSTLTGANGSERTQALSSAASQASSALQQLGDLLNTKSGDTYVFGGSDGTQAPVAADDALGTGPLATAIGASVAGLGANGAAATLSDILSAATNTADGAPFAASVNGAAPANGTTVIGADETVADRVAATSGTLTEPSSTSTGSPIRDLVAVLSAVAGLSSSSGSTAAFGSFVTDLQTTLTGAVTGLSSLSGRMGASQDLLAGTSATYATLGTALSSQMASLTSVDLPTVLTEAQQTSTAIQASYQLIAALKGLSLADYI